MIDKIKTDKDFTKLPSVENSLLLGKFPMKEPSKNVQVDSFQGLAMTFDETFSNELMLSDLQKSLNEAIKWETQCDVHRYLSMAMGITKQTPEVFYSKDFENSSMSELEKAEAIKERVDDFYAFEEKWEKRSHLAKENRRKERENSIDTWYHIVTRALKENGESWDDIISQTITEEQKKVDPFRDKDVDYVEFRLWTDNHVYYSFEECDSDWIESFYSCKSIPRNP